VMMLRKIDISRTWQLARLTFAALKAKRDMFAEELERTQQCLSNMQRSNTELRAALTELTDAVRRRWQAEAELADLYRQREIERAQKAERAGGLLH